MWDIAVRNRPLDRNDGRNVKRSAYVSGSGRDFCDGELNYTGCETSRSETDHWTGTTEGTWNVLRTLREVDAISAMANSTTKKRLLVSRFSIYIGWLGARGTSPDILGSKTSQCEVLGLRWQSQPNFWNSILLKIFIIITYTLYWYFCFCFQNIVISTIVGLFLLSRIKFFLWADKLLEHLSDDNLMTVPREKTSLSWLK